MAHEYFVTFVHFYSLSFTNSCSFRDTIRNYFYNPDLYNIHNYTCKCKIAIRISVKTTAKQNKYCIDILRTYFKIQEVYIHC